MGFGQATTALYFQDVAHWDAARSPLQPLVPQCSLGGCRTLWGCKGRASHVTPLAPALWLRFSVRCTRASSKAAAPQPLQEKVMGWHHWALAHPGAKRMEESIRLMRAWPGLRDAAKKHCKPCGQCQRCKAARKKKHGLLPEKQGEAAKRGRASAGLWGPKPAVSKNGYTCQAHAMAMAGPAAGWLEYAQLYAGEAAAACRCQQILDTVWLARYPRPKRNWIWQWL